MSEVDVCLDNILALANEIRTYTEAAEVDTSLIRDRASAAELIFFLGFGYHSQNLKWLKNVIVDSGNASIVGTTYGLGKLQADNARDNLRTVFSRTVHSLDRRFTDLNIQDYFSDVYDIE